MQTTWKQSVIYMYHIHSCISAGKNIKAKSLSGCQATEWHIVDGRFYLWFIWEQLFKCADHACLDKFTMHEWCQSLPQLISDFETGHRSCYCCVTRLPLLLAQRLRAISVFTSLRSWKEPTVKIAVCTAVKISLEILLCL